MQISAGDEEVEDQFSSFDIDPTEKQLLTVSRKSMLIKGSAATAAPAPVSTSTRPAAATVTVSGSAPSDDDESDALEDNTATSAPQPKPTLTRAAERQARKRRREEAVQAATSEAVGNTMSSVHGAIAAIADRLPFVISAEYNPCAGKMLKQMVAVLVPLATPAEQKGELTWEQVEAGTARPSTRHEGGTA